MAKKRRRSLAPEERTQAAYGEIKDEAEQESPARQVDPNPEGAKDGGQEEANGPIEFDR